MDKHTEFSLNYRTGTLSLDSLPLPYMMEAPLLSQRAGTLSLCPLFLSADSSKDPDFLLINKMELQSFSLLCKQTGKCKSIPVGKFQALLCFSFPTK